MTLETALQTSASSEHRRTERERIQLPRVARIARAILWIGNLTCDTSVADRLTRRAARRILPKHDHNEDGLVRIGQPDSFADSAGERPATLLSAGDRTRAA